jgi:prolyl-tRNA editing enzyme YbaK/EbsC (Cys-tRNA(Pro) deacylase)
LTPADVQAALDRFNLGIKLRFFENSTATSQLAAEEIGCELGQIAKSICFMVNAQPALVIASGDQRVDDRKLAGLLNISRKQIKLATAEQCAEVFGYAPGGVPPLGHRVSIPTVFIDDSLKRYARVYPAGGSSNAIFELTLDQLALISGGVFADVKREAASEQ